MARIYNPTMLMLDPSNVMNAVRLGREREEQERSARKDILTGVKSLGEAAGGFTGRALRQSEIGELPEDSDDEWKAAVERFVDTGDISGINAYKQRKAEEAYREKMAGIQEASASAAKKSAENTAKELSLKEKAALDKERADYEYGLKKAIRKADEAKTEKEYKDAAEDYLYYKRKLNLSEVADEDIPKMPEMPKFGTEPTGAGEGAEKGAFGGESYEGRKRNIEDRINKGWQTEEERNRLADEIKDLSNTEKGSSDKELVGYLDKVLKGKSQEMKDAEARLYRRKMADGWKAMDKADRYSLTKKDPKTAKKMQDAYKEFYGGE